MDDCDDANHSDALSYDTCTDDHVHDKTSNRFSLSKLPQKVFLLIARGYSESILAIFFKVRYDQSSHILRHDTDHPQLDWISISSVTGRPDTSVCQKL